MKFPKLSKLFKKKYIVIYVIIFLLIVSVLVFYFKGFIENMSFKVDEKLHSVNSSKANNLLDHATAISGNIITTANAKQIPIGNTIPSQFTSQFAEITKDKDSATKLQTEVINSKGKKNITDSDINWAVPISKQYSLANDRLAGNAISKTKATLIDITSKK